MELLGNFELLGVGVVVVQFLLMRGIEAAADFVADDLLSDGAVLDSLLEVLKRDSLRGGGLFEGFHGVEMVLLADLVETAHGFGFAGDAEFLSLGKQYLLVDHVAEQVLLLRVEVGLCGVRALGFLQERLLSLLVLTTGDDLVVHACNDVFHHFAIGRDGRGGRQGRKLQWRGAELIVGTLHLSQSRDNAKGGYGQCNREQSTRKQPARGGITILLLDHPFLYSPCP